MIVENDGKGKIKLDCSYDEIAKIISVLDKYWLVNDDENIKQLAYELHNPKEDMNKMGNKTGCFSVSDLKNKRKRQETSKCNVSTEEVNNL